MNKPRDLSAEDHADRFQSQPLLIKVWRCRWLLLVVPQFFYYLLTSTGVEVALLWRLAFTNATTKMRWYYTFEEVFGHLVEHQRKK